MSASATPGYIAPRSPSWRVAPSFSGGGDIAAKPPSLPTTDVDSFRPSLPATRTFSLNSLSGLAQQMTQQLARYVLQTYIPHPIPFVQRLVSQISRLVFFHPSLSFLPWSSRFSFDDAQAVKRLRNALNSGVGVVLAGSHPENMDGSAIMEMHHQIGHFPAFIPFTSELLSQFGHYMPTLLLFLLKPIFSALGLAPINRGNRSNELKAHGVRTLVNGKCFSLFPEGIIYLGPRVFPMQKGAVEIALKAALESDFQKPILLQPFAHVYLHRDAVQREKNTRTLLKKLERGLNHQGVSPPPASISENLHRRVFTVGEQLIEHTRQVHDVPRPANWDTMDFWDKALYVQKHSLQAMERRYGVPTDENRLLHNQLMKIRSRIWEQLATLPPQTLKMQRARLKQDLQRANDLHFLESFTRADLHDYGNGKELDREMLLIYLRRFGFLIGWNNKGMMLGKRDITARLLDPVDMRDYAKEYAAKASQSEKDRYAAMLTEKLLQTPIQNAVNQLWKSGLSHL